MTEVIQARPLRGSRISSFYPVKQLPPLSSLDSAFQLQEYISLLIRLDVHDVDTIVSIPATDKSNPENATSPPPPPLQETPASEQEQKAEGDSVAKESAAEDKAEEDADAKADEDKDSSGASSKKDTSVDESCWIYEQLRRLAQDLSHPLITMLQQECTRATCPEMKAGEWLYLCVAHGNDGAMEQCCAIDYILHTLDSATALLNSPRAFPSRLQIPQTSHRHFSSLARRLGRIFAHAYFHHREAFEQAEAESSLYARFLALTSKFDLVPAEFLVIPTRMLPLSSSEGDDDDHRRSGLSSSSADNQGPKLLGASVGGLSEINTDVPLGGSPTSARPGRSTSGPQSLQGQQQQTQNPPGLTVDQAAVPRGQSPRKTGRSRTDTMVYSEGFNVAEELAKHVESSTSEELAKHAESSTSESDNTNTQPRSSTPPIEQEHHQDQDSALTVPDSPLEHTEHQITSLPTPTQEEEEKKEKEETQQRHERGETPGPEDSHAPAPEPEVDAASSGAPSSTDAPELEAESSAEVQSESKEGEEASVPDPVAPAPAPASDEAKSTPEAETSPTAAASDTTSSEAPAPSAAAAAEVELTEGKTSSAEDTEPESAPAPPAAEEGKAEPDSAAVVDADAEKKEDEKDETEPAPAPAEVPSGADEAGIPAGASYASVAATAAESPTEGTTTEEPKLEGKAEEEKKVEADAEGGESA